MSSTVSTNLSFKGAPFIEIFASQGSNPLSRIRISDRRAAKHISHQFDKSAKSYVIDLPLIPSVPGATIVLPREERKSLALAHRFLVLQAFFPSNNASITLVVKDAKKGRRRLIFSSSFRDTHRTPLHAQLPLGRDILPREQWINACFDMETLVSYAFGLESVEHGTLEEIHIGSTCRLRRVFMSAQDPIAEVMIPRKLQYAGGVDFDTVMIDMDSFDMPVEDQDPEHEGFVDDPSPEVSQDRSTLPPSRRDHSARAAATHHIAFGRITKGSPPHQPSTARSSPARPKHSARMTSSAQARVRKESDVGTAAAHRPQHCAHETSEHRIKRCPPSSVPQRRAVQNSGSREDVARHGMKSAGTRPRDGHCSSKNRKSANATTRNQQPTKTQYNNELSISVQKETVHNNTRYPSGDEGDREGESFESDLEEVEEERKPYDHSRYETAMRISSSDAEGTDPSPLLDPDERQQQYKTVEDDVQRALSSEGSESEVRVSHLWKEIDATSMPDHVQSFTTSRTSSSTLKSAVQSSEELLPSSRLSCEEEYLLRRGANNSQHEKSVGVSSHSNDAMYDVIEMLEKEARLSDSTLRQEDHQEGDDCVLVSGEDIQTGWSKQSWNCGGHWSPEASTSDKEDSIEFMNNSKTEDQSWETKRHSRALTKSPEVPKSDDDDDDGDSDGESNDETFYSRSESDDNNEHRIRDIEFESGSDIDDDDDDDDDSEADITAYLHHDSENDEDDFKVVTETEHPYDKYGTSETPHTTSEPAATTSPDDEIELIYDESLNLYYDPVSNTFFMPKV